MEIEINSKLLTLNCSPRVHATVCNGYFEGATVVDRENWTFNPERFKAAYKIVLACDSHTAVKLPAVSLHLFDVLTSTNQTAWELCDRGADAGTVVIALQQTAGKGQWGRQWSSPAGGLYLSVLLAPNLAIEHSAQLTLCSAWGIARTLRKIPGKLSGVSDQIPVQVKWLNDLVLQGRKLGGILTETRIRQGQISRAVVGVGINWANSVPETGVNLKSFLKQQEIPLIESLEMLAALTIYGVLFGYESWQQKGMEALLPSYLELLAFRDRPLVIDGRAGTIVGVTPQGELRVCLSTADTDSPQNVEVLLKPGTISLGYEV